jgi:predicted RNA binding protein YcfA (HicA-like mRNA interferase family)
MQWPKFRRILQRKPLDYRITRQSGSHVRMESDRYPPLTLAFHDKAEIPGGLIRRILTKGVGLTDDEARRLL